MDNVCHSLMGAALGKAGLARRTTLGMSTLVIANNLPDLDVAVFATNTLVMSFRRGWTHGVLAQAVLPLALAGAMLAYDRFVVQKRRRLLRHPRRRVSSRCWRTSACSRTSTWTSSTATACGC